MGKPILLLAVTLLLSGCLNNGGYRVLSFFFDGVPVPGSAKSSGEHPTQGGGEADGQAPESTTAAPSNAAVPAVSMHSPYAKGSCASCHDVSSSNARLKEGNDLCLMCHTTVLTGREVVHVVAMIDCLICHDPHTSVNAKLLVRGVPDLCLDCHTRDSVEEKHGEIAGCLSCHNPHESDMASLLDFK
jgi:predicted CXXCH cytochrome family protein